MGMELFGCGRGGKHCMIKLHVIKRHPLPSLFFFYNETPVQWCLSHLLRAIKEPLGAGNTL